jgi:tetratricopeptide (TPR) repeat protein
MAGKIKSDFEIVTAESRKLAIAWQHGFINYDHLFVAMLQNKCKATKYLAHCDSDYWEAKIKGLYPATGKQKQRDLMPLTVEAERVVRHAYQISGIDDFAPTSSIHLLLAILSYDNDVSKAFCKAGILIEDITGAEFKNPVKRFPSPVKAVREKPYSKVEVFLLPKVLKKKRVEVLHRNALNFYHYRQFEDVIKICRIGLSLSADYVHFKILMAYSSLKLLDFEPALSIMTELVELKPGDANFMLSLSLIYDKMGNHQKAALILDELLLQQPDNAHFLNNKGFNLQLQEHYAESVPFFERAEEADLLKAYALDNLGFSKFKLGNVEKGLELINKSLELDKGNPYAYKNRGIVLMEQGQKTEAKQNFILALKFGYTENYGDEVEKLLHSLSPEDPI